MKKVLKWGGISLAVILLLAFIMGMVFYFIARTPEERLLSKLKGTYEVSKILSKSAFPSEIEEQKAEVLGTKIFLDADFLAKDDTGNGDGVKRYQVITSPTFEAMKLSSPSANYQVTNQTAKLIQESSDSLVWDNGECLMVSNMSMDSQRAVTDVFFLFGNDIYFCGEGGGTVFQLNKLTHSVPIPVGRNLTIEYIQYGTSQENSEKEDYLIVEKEPVGYFSKDRFLLKEFERAYPHYFPKPNISRYKVVENPSYDKHVLTEAYMQNAEKRVIEDVAHVLGDTGKLSDYQEPYMVILDCSPAEYIRLYSFDGEMYLNRVGLLVRVSGK